LLSTRVDSKLYVAPAPDTALMVPLVTICDHRATSTPWGTSMTDQWAVPPGSGKAVPSVPDLPPPSVPDLPAPPLEATGRYAQGTEGLRSTAKWLLAAFAGVGAVLLAGVQITALGSLGGSNWPRLIGAWASLGAALAAVGYMIQQTTRVLTDQWVTLAELSNEDINNDLQPTPDQRRVDTVRELLARIELNRQQLYFHVAASVPDLHRALRQANTAAQALGTIEGPPSGRLLWAVARAEYIRYTAAQVTDFANYHRTLGVFTSLKPRLAVAASCTAVAIAIFAYAANPAVT